MTKLEWAIDVFSKNGIKTRVNKDNKIIISHYCQPKEATFKELGINEDELIENVVACEGVFDALKSSLTKFPLEVSQEIRLYKENEILEMPNLRAVGVLICNQKLKKLPKLKAASSISMENSSINSLPKLKEAGIIIAQNSNLKELPSLERIGNMCIIDCPIQEIKELKEAKDVFICSSDENNKLDIKSLLSLENVEKMFVANSNLKSLPKLKKAQKLAFYNCEIKSIKESVCKDVEIETKISDSELNDKFDTFTNWYNSNILLKSMDLLGEVVNKIKE